MLQMSLIPPLTLYPSLFSPTHSPMMTFYVNKFHTCAYKDTSICREIISNSFIISFLLKILSDKGKLLIVILSKEVAVLSGVADCGGGEGEVNN